MSRAADNLAHLGRAMQQQVCGVHPDSGEKQMKNADTPAMPSMLKAGDMARSEGGLTKREYFAGLAMQGFLSGVNGDSNIHDTPQEWVKDMAECSVEFADALLAELEKEAS